MKIADLNSQLAISHTIQSYVKHQYMTDINSKIALKRAQQKIAVQALLISRMIESDSIPVFIDLFKSGITIEISPPNAAASSSSTSTLSPPTSPRVTSLSQIILTSSSLGYRELYKALIDKQQHCPLRFKKLAIFLLGRYYDEIVWNEGRVLRLLPSEIAPIAELFISASKSSWWDTLAKTLSTAHHVYRDFENRHSHSNAKPSYWALGYPTLEDMVAAFTPEDFQSYRQFHQNCCGLAAITSSPASSIFMTPKQLRDRNREKRKAKSLFKKNK